VCDIVGKIMIGLKEVFRIILSQCQPVQQQTTLKVLGCESELNGERPKPNRLSNGAALNFMELPVAGRLE
jgi:hypothetical protein